MTLPILHGVGDMGGRIVEIKHIPYMHEVYQVWFTNGYAASVVRGPRTYGGLEGLWEIGVLDKNGELDYSTPITADVIGYLSSEEAAAIMFAIANLPAQDTGVLNEASTDGQLGQA